MASLKLVGGELVLPDGIIPGNLVTNDGRLTSIEIGKGRSITQDEGDSPLGTIDCTGRLIAPGFIDWQINGAAGIDLTRAPERVYEVAAVLTQYGVTRFCPTSISSDEPTRARVLRTAIDVEAVKPRGDGARIHGWHLEGPWLSADKSGVHDTTHFGSPSMDVARELTRANGIAVVTLAPELPGSLRVIAALRSAGVVVSIGHSTASAAEVADAVVAGATAVTHLFNALPSLHHRDPGVVGAALGGADLMCGVIVDGVHIDPIVVSAIWRVLGVDRFMLVTDATAALGSPDGDDVPLGSEVMRVVDGAVRHSDGVLAGSALSMDQAVRNLVTWSDAGVSEALHVASRTPARLLLLPDVGEIRLGWAADLVVMTQDLRVVYTIVDGHIVYAA